MLHLTLPYPPSINHYYRTVLVNHMGEDGVKRKQSRMLISADGRTYRERVAAAVIAQRKSLQLAFPNERLGIEIDVTVPDRRKRDIDNLLKSLLDALTHVRVWTDDGQLDEITIRRRGVDDEGKAVVRVWALT